LESESMTSRAIGLCSCRRTTRRSRCTRRLRSIHYAGGSSWKGRLCASAGSEEWQWHTHGWDQGKAGGCARGSGNDLSQVEGAQEVPENCSFPAVVPETEIDFNLEQEREIIPTRAGVRPLRIGRVGRVVGTLQGTDRGKCGKTQGTAFSVWVGCAPVRGRKDSSRGV
jgi:hypothetical protein